MKRFFLITAACLLAQAVSTMAQQPPAAEPQTEKALVNRAFLDVPHIQQPPHLLHCGPTVVLMAFEGITGLKLTVQDMLHVSNVVAQGVADGKKGATAAKVLPKLGMPVETRGFNPTKSKDPVAVLSMAQKAMDDYVVPAMKAGGGVLLQINSSASTAHMVFLVGYDSSAHEFTIKNPAHTESYRLSKDELTRKWPCKYKAGGAFQLQAYVIKAPEPRSAKYVKPEPSRQLPLDDTIRGLIGTHKAESLEELDKLSPRFKWHDMAKFWEKGRSAETVTGLAQILKLQIAAGQPVLIGARSSNGIGFHVACAHGYQGEYDDVKGTVDVLTLDGTRGLDNTALIKSCCFAKGSVTHLFIGFSTQNPSLPNRTLKALN
ncbi:MAG: hypothetical protein U1F81_14160 [Verrucomicrobiaceae bacterium]